MGNRHHHKKERADVRARMARTGETYQQALVRIRAAAAGRPVDLVRAAYFGVPVTLATYEIEGRLACMAVTSPVRLGPFPPSPLAALAARGHRVVH